LFGTNDKQGGLLILILCCIIEKVASSRGMTHLALPVEGNVAYHHWSIGDVTMLIRVKYHGFVPQQVCLPCLWF